MADTTLAAACGADDTDIRLAAAVGSDGSILLIDDEYLGIELRAATINPQVARGLFGSTRAEHGAGTEVDVVYPVIDAAPGSSGGGPPAPHHVSHELGGSDELDVTGLPGAGGGGGSSVRAFTVTLADVLAALGTIKAAAQVGGSDVRYEARSAGIAGNLIAILSDVQPSVGTLTVEVVDTTITLHLKTDGDSVVLSTTDEVGAAITASPEANALVHALVNTNFVPYDFGDCYLADGTSELTLASLDEGDVIWDATCFFPESWDATTVLSWRVGVGVADLFYDGVPDSSLGDDTGTAGVAVENSEPQFNTLKRLRLTAPGDFICRISCDSGVNPTVGEALLLVDVRSQAA